jgi:hypothetical protein
MAWAVDSGRPVAVLDIAEPTRRFWFHRSGQAGESLYVPYPLDTR